MVKGIVKLDAKREFRVFPNSSHGRSLADREIRVELSRTVDDALTDVTITR